MTRRTGRDAAAPALCGLILEGSAAETEGRKDTDNLVRFHAMEIVDGVPEKEAKTVCLGPRYLLNAAGAGSKFSLATLTDGKKYLVGIAARLLKTKLSARGNAGRSSGGQSD